MTDGSWPLRAELAGLSDYVWGRLTQRLDGLTDAEFFWEPVPGCWTVRRGGDGTFTQDSHRPEPDPPPVTTIAWRIAHLTGDQRFRSWLGLAPRPGQRPGQRPVPGSAASALALVRTAGADMGQDLREVTDGWLWQPVGPAGGPFHAATRVSWVLHVLDEVIHHGAEIGVLRDLYRARRDQ